MCIFERGQLVWLQQALTVASVILGMSLMGIIHPPAGALCLVFLGAYNTGSTDERVSPPLSDIFVLVLRGADICRRPLY